MLMSSNDGSKDWKFSKTLAYNSTYDGRIGLT